MGGGAAQAAQRKSAEDRRASATLSWRFSWVYRS